MPHDAVGPLLVGHVAFVDPPEEVGALLQGLKEGQISVTPNTAGREKYLVHGCCGWGIVDHDGLKKNAL